MIEKYLASLSPGKRVDLPKEYMALDFEVFRGDRLIESMPAFLSLLIGILLFCILCNLLNLI